MLRKEWAGTYNARMIDMPTVNEQITDTVNKMMEVMAALSSGQQGAKVAQSTPPETATG
jgi:hypothetical protein